MKLLLINTCGVEASIALAYTLPPELVSVVTMPGRSASELLVKELRRTMSAVGWGPTELEAIAVVTGPGSFTGVRVGLSAAKGLSEATGASLIAISRLGLLADVATRNVEPRPQTVCVLLDAGRGDLYCGQFRDGTPLGDSLLSLDAALARAEESDLVVVCEDTVERALAGRISAVSIPEPSAADALAPALDLFERAEIFDSATLDANYLRRTDAEIFSSPPRPSSV